jgi:hypothetical protein
MLCPARQALCDCEKGVIFLKEIYQLWSPTGQRPCFQNNAPVGRHPDHTMAPFAAGVKNKDLPPIFLKCDMASLVPPYRGNLSTEYPKPHYLPSVRGFH